MNMPANQAQPAGMPPQVEGPTDDEDADTPFDFPERRIVQAVDTKPVKTRAARSIWDAATNGFGGAGFAMVLAEMPLYRVERGPGVVRVVRLQHDETPEFMEKERARREAQRFLCPPPRPTKGAKTRGKKVKIGRASCRERV